jgi:hypothetical protein
LEYRGAPSKFLFVADKRVLVADLEKAVRFAYMRCS